jgi:hypothetical protein
MTLRRKIHQGAAATKRTGKTDSANRPDAAPEPRPLRSPLSNSSEKIPAGRPLCLHRFRNARGPASSLVPGCAGCALTTTGLPAASADAVSPPATENASGKLLAPKTATGPSGRSMDRTSGFGGVRAAIGRVDTRHHPGALFHHSGKESQLPTGTRYLACEARQRQRCLQVRAFNQRRRSSVDAVRNAAQQTPTLAARSRGQRRPTLSPPLRQHDLPRCQSPRKTQAATPGRSPGSIAVKLRAALVRADLACNHRTSRTRIMLG